MQRNVMHVCTSKKYIDLNETKQVDQFIPLYERVIFPQLLGFGDESYHWLMNEHAAFYQLWYVKTTVLKVFDANSKILFFSPTA